MISTPTFSLISFLNLPTNSSIPWVAIGAITAAVITGLIAFTAMVVTKENSVSQFRQDWIDSIRSELVVFLYSLKEFYKLSKEEEGKRLKAKKDLIKKIEKNYLTLRLKLNGSQEHDRALKKRINELYFNFQEVCAKKNNTQETFTSYYDELIKPDTSNIDIDIFLTNEWRRVKNGEKWFSYSKSVLICLFGLILSLIFSYITTQLEPNIINLDFKFWSVAFASATLIISLYIIFHPNRKP